STRARAVFERLQRIESRIAHRTHGNAGTNRGTHNRVSQSGCGDISNADESDDGGDGTLRGRGDAAGDRGLASAIGGDEGCIVRYFLSAIIIKVNSTPLTPNKTIDVNLRSN